jgi:hypothetical protein
MPVSEQPATPINRNTTSRSVRSLLNFISLLLMSRS